MSLAQSCCVIAIIVSQVADNTQGYVPALSTTFNMRLLFLPYDTPPGTLVYRLRAYDADNDVLNFGIRQAEGRLLFDVQSTGTYEADVILKSNLQKGRKYDLTIFVTDGQTTTEVPSTIRVTDNSSKQQVFLSDTLLANVPEDGVPGRKVAEVEAYVDKDWMNPPTFELRGSQKFMIRSDVGTNPDSETIKAEIFIRDDLDFEDQNIYTLTVIALNGFRRPEVDTRNIATMKVVVVVDDVADSAPSWVQAPPVTAIPDSLTKGEKIMTVKATDEDRGATRVLRYRLDSEASPWAKYFSIDAESGDLLLDVEMPELREKLYEDAPIVLAVVAEEIAGDSSSTGSKYPLLSSTAMLGFRVVDGNNGAPVFQSDRYVGYIAENSPAYTPIHFKDSNYVPRVVDHDQGSNGTFQLYLDGVDAFEVSPSIVSHEAVFTIRVKNSAQIDYEKVNEFSFKLMAKELRKDNPLKTYVDVVVLVEDENDQKPAFVKELYEADLTENAQPGTSVVQVQATDKDAGSFGMVKYTRITGSIADSLVLNRDTGLVTVRSSEGLDREAGVKHVVNIEARDDSGRGHVASVQLIIHVTDANDNPPRFTAPYFYVGVLNRDLTGLQQPVIVQAHDSDQENTVNSEIVYQIVGGDYHDKFAIDESSGAISLVESLASSSGTGSGRTRADDLPLITLRIRAHDKGVPVLNSDEIPVYIHTQAYMNRSLSLIVPDRINFVRSRMDQYQKALSRLTGGNVRITDLSSVSGSDSGKYNDHTEIKAWATYSSSAVIDVQQAVRELNAALNRSCTDSSVTVRTAQVRLPDDGDIFFWIMIVLIILIIIAIIVLIIYCCCCISRKRSGSADSRVYPEDRTVLVRHEEPIVYHSEDNGVSNQAGFERLKRTDRGYWQFEKREPERMSPEDEGGEYNHEYVHEEDGKMASDGRHVNYRRVAMMPTEYRSVSGAYYDDDGRRVRNVRNKYGNEVILDVNEAPLRRGERAYMRPHSEGQLRRGKVIIVNRNEWDDVRQGRMVDEMSPEEYMEHVEKYGRRGKILRPEGRRGARKVRGRVVHYNRDESDDEVYEEEIGPSISQQTSVVDSQSNGDFDDDVSGTSITRHNRFQQAGATLSDVENENLRFSRHGNGSHAKQTAQKMQKSSNEQTMSRGVVLRRLEDVNEEEEGQSTTSGSRRSAKATETARTVRSVVEMTPVVEDFQVNDPTVDRWKTVDQLVVVENQQRKDQPLQTVDQLVVENQQRKAQPLQSVDQLAVENQQRNAHPLQIVPTVETDESNVGNQIEMTETTMDSRNKEVGVVQEVSERTVVEATSINVDQPPRYMDWHKKGGKISNESDEIKLTRVTNDDDHDSGISRSSIQTRMNPMLEKKSIFTIAYDGVQSKHKVVANADIVRTPTPP